MRPAIRDAVTSLRLRGGSPPGHRQNEDALVSVAPLWAQAYRAHALHVPNHPGKGRILRSLHARGLRTRRPFACRMANGAWLAIRPEEGLLVNETVGWTCFRERRWDPHVEACLRRTLHPGQAAIDAGANIGYMTAVMAQCVGRSGRVWAFEPVAETYELLELCRSLNNLTQVTAVRSALGAADGSTEITYDPRHSGLATMHPAQVAGVVQQVQVRTLDGMAAAGEVQRRPDLIKIDVEGHELDVLLGARNMIAEASPIIVFELNQRAATAAGWALAHVAELLTPLGDYRFHVIDADGEYPLDPLAFRLDRDDLSDPHVDVLARPS